MWIPLSEIDLTRSEHFGHKATRLLQALKRGLPLPASWVLSCEELEQLRGEPERASLAARELLALAPEVGKFLLRSSSPLEDRVDSSAAGLFRSIPSEANEECLARALCEMADSTRDPHLAELLETRPGAVTLAVLAQEHLALEIWATVECELRAGKERHMRVEGSVHCTDGPLPFEFDLSFPPVVSEFKEALSQMNAKLRTYRESIAAALALVRKAIEQEEGIWLLELGTSAHGPVLLQRRPVRQLSPSRTHAPQLEMPRREDPLLRDFPLFAGDTRTRWEHDASHSPRALCPLLAGNFIRWILSKGEEHSTRVIHGRWYEVATSEQEEEEDPSKAEASLREALRDWNERRLPELERGLKELAAQYSPLPSASSWPSFVRTWLAWQDKYFDGSASTLRRLAALLTKELERSGQSLPPLPETIADCRERELDRLAASFVTMDEEVRERELEEFLLHHGHVAPGPSDGRSVPWQEDAAPLRAELQRRADSTAAGESPAPPPQPQTSHGGEWNSAAPQLAARAFAKLEDDDDLLARAYALFRGCALDLQAWLVPEKESAVILELLPDDLEELLACAPSERAERFERALARGKALSARWESEFSRANPREKEPIERGSILRGKALAAGSASGELCILPSAQSAGGPPRGAILVVPLVLPADAIVFSRCAALICESGAVLGHAAVLAREKKIPALILPGACSSLAQATRARVDGSRGEVEILGVREEGPGQ